MIDKETILEKDIPFVIAGLKERNLIREVALRTQSFEITQESNPTGQAKWDVVILSANTKYVVELKIRKEYYVNDYKGFMIEEKKYAALKNIQNIKGYIPLYLNFFKNGYQIWNLNEIPVPCWGLKEYKKYTVIQKGGILKELKLSADLPNALASKHLFKWNLSDKEYENLAYQELNEKYIII
jgi:hypothetical protein